MATPSTPGTAVSIVSATKLAVNIAVTDLAGVAAEGDFHFTAIGSLASDLVGA